MTDERARQIERIVDAIASAILALAVVVALKRCGLSTAAIAAGGVAIAGVCWLGLRSIPLKAQQFHVPSFALPDVSEDALLLTDDDRVGHPTELVLDDIAAHVGSGSRVIRLFDPAAIPSAGELGARIDRHLHMHGLVESADASQDLFDALAQLRRSLR